MMNCITIPGLCCLILISITVESSIFPYSRGKIDLNTTFDQDAEKVYDYSFIPRVPKKCKHIGYCEVAYNYPTKYVAHIIEHHNIFNVSNCLQTEEENYPVQKTGLEFNLCETVEGFSEPLAALSKQGNWHFILNLKGHAVNKFWTVRCKHQNSENGGQCSNDFNMIHARSTLCRQKSEYVTMQALSHSGQVINESFIRPTCCACVVKDIDDNI